MAKKTQRLAPAAPARFGAPVSVSEQRAERALGILLVQAGIYVNVANAIQVEVVAPFFVNQETTRRVQHRDGADVQTAIKQVAHQHNARQPQNGATDC